jgi:hypothetical protein
MPFFHQIMQNNIKLFCNIIIFFSSTKLVALAYFYMSVSIVQSRPTEDFLCVLLSLVEFNVPCVRRADEKHR